MIITHKKMLVLGYKKTFELLSNVKHILLIDKSEMKDGKIIIKEVHHSFMGEM